MLDTVREIQERHSAVKDLERQLLGLHQIFLDMAVLVEAQGEMLDNIETQAREKGDRGHRGPKRAGVCAHPSPHSPPHQVAKANEYVNQGNKALTSAKALQKDTRKWMCCAVMILLSICLIVVLAVVKPWQARAAWARPGASHTPRVTPREQRPDTPLCSLPLHRTESHDWQATRYSILPLVLVQYRRRHTHTHTLHGGQDCMGASECPATACGGPQSCCTCTGCSARTGRACT